MSLLEKYSLGNIDGERRLKRIKIREIVANLERLKKPITYLTQECVMFLHQGSKVTFFFKTNYYTGPTVKDGRGIENFINEIS